MVNGETLIETSTVILHKGVVSRVEKSIMFNGARWTTVRIVPTSQGKKFEMTVSYPGQGTSMKRGKIEDLLESFDPLQRSEYLALLGLAEPIPGMEFEIKFV